MGFGRSEHNKRFEHQSAANLAQSLASLEQVLYKPCDLTELAGIIKSQNVTDLYRAFHPGDYEKEALQHLMELFDLELHTAYSLSLFHEGQLPFSKERLPKTFTQFRKRVENLAVVRPLPSPDALPQHIDLAIPRVCMLSEVNASIFYHFNGGEAQAKAHLESYFDSQRPQTYKLVRNELDGWDNSTKMSPWLAQGNLSPRQVWYEVNNHEAHHGENDSTYWIKFELLWREFFHWYAHWHGRDLFKSSGLKENERDWGQDERVFENWCSGNTGYDIVDACMNQLNHTGFMSNRGRQLVASCLIHELGLDWRLGALYFEHNLIDYDVGSNWGNWQYIAGVGADAKPVRRFDLEKQTQMYDPEREFIDFWTESDDLDREERKCG
ncbi:cryptochrome [Vibrio ishigakensis]|uniref:Cryptochrome DASH n=2 Tax=Vibrio ishigakensis TaxID=1481914 RepID=A0A0B8NWN7_9VIBR|nr:cryptochrome [Vibrio ishigakensis]